jgi:DNA polymerase I-like protein with 3'-5' exonuclease and polymerase domains
MEATLAGKQLIMHNAKFDLQVLARNGISLYGNPIFDTMIAHQLLDENSSHGLKHLAKTILGAEIKMEQNPMVERAVAQWKASCERIARSRLQCSQIICRKFLSYCLVIKTKSLF